MARTAVQLYTLRDVEKSLPALLEAVADAGFEGVEFAYRVTDADASAVVTTLDDLGLVPVAAHVPVERVEGAPADAAAFYRELGCERLVVPHLDAEYFDSREGVSRAADRLAAVAEDLAGPGLDLLYHNHAHEFVDLGHGTAYEALVEATDERVGFELDVGHATRAGADPVDLLGRYGDRMPLVHLTDVDEDGEAVLPGEGVVDLAGCVRAFRDHGGEWLVYEYEGRTPLTTLEEAREAIRGL